MWNLAAQTRPVLHSTSFLPVPTLPYNLATILLLAFSLFQLVFALSQFLCSESNKSVNTHNRLRYFLTNKIFLLRVMYRYVRVIFIVKCVTITRFFIAYAALWWKSIIFIVLSSLETLHDTAQYRDSIFSLLNRLLRIRLKRQNPLLSYIRERKRKYNANVQRRVQYTLLLLYLMLIMSYCE
jgi:hypothetical protein